MTQTIEAGEYPGLSIADYLAIPAIGSGVIKAMLDRCPAAAWHCSHLNPHLDRVPTTLTDNGELAHALVLEDCESRVCLIDPAEYPAKTSGNIPDGWGNKAIRGARDEARASGKIPVLLPQWERIKGMADSARTFIDSLRALEPAVWKAFQPDGGISELTAVWQEGDVLCRMRSDKISNDRAVDIDLKFVSRSAHPEGFARSGLLGMGYATAAGWYRRGIRKLHGVEAAYLFIVVEQEPPYLASLVGMDPAWTAYADARAARGLRDWEACQANGRWPGYPARAAYPEMPAWELARMESQEAEQPFGIEYDVAKLFKKSEHAT